MKKFTFILLPLLVLTLGAWAGVGQAKENDDNDFKSALEMMLKARQSFRDAKVEEKTKADIEVKARAEAKVEAKKDREEAQKRKEERRRETLLKLIDLQVKWLNRVKERVQNMPDITADLKTEFNVEIEATLSKLADLKVRVQGAADDASLKIYGKEVQDFFKTKREVIKKIVDAIHASRANVFVTRARERASAIRARLQELKVEGKATAVLEADLGAAEAKIDAAASAIVKRDFRAVVENLKDAYQKFRAIAAAAKKL